MTMSNKEFVTLVMEAKKDGKNQDYIAEKMGIKKTSVASRISNMRKQGVKIPMFPRGRKNEIDVQALNTLIESEPCN